jgi:hypothetical protein
MTRFHLKQFEKSFLFYHGNQFIALSYVEAIGLHRCFMVNREDKSDGLCIS